MRLARGVVGSRTAAVSRGFVPFGEKPFQGGFQRNQNDKNHRGGSPAWIVGRQVWYGELLSLVKGLSQNEEPLSSVNRNEQVANQGLIRVPRFLVLRKGNQKERFGG